MEFRFEKDTLGTVEVPDNAYYGAQTARAIVNFPISGLKPHPALVWATIVVKKCAALANTATGRLARQVGEAIVAAAEEALNGNFDGQFCGRSVSGRCRDIAQYERQRSAGQPGARNCWVGSGENIPGYTPTIMSIWHNPPMTSSPRPCGCRAADVFPAPN